MTIKRVRMICWTLTAVMAAGAVLALLAAALLPLESAGGMAAGAGKAKSRATVPSQALTMADFEPLLTGRLRPLPPPPPPPPPVPQVVPIVQSAPPVPPAPEAPSVQLLGTVVEANNSYAIFQTADGIQVKRQGDTIGESKVQEITEGVAVLKRTNGEPQRLSVPPPPGE